MRDDPPLSITLSNDQNDPVDEERIHSIARRTAAAEAGSGEISIVLVGEQEMARLNYLYAGDEGPTDVLSFPIDGPDDRTGDVPRIIGEVYVCPSIAKRQAEGSFEEEMDLLVAHGVLHLLGYDHDTEVAADQMRQKETAVTGRSGARSS